MLTERVRALHAPVHPYFRTRQERLGNKSKLELFVSAKYVYIYSLRNLQGG